MSDSTGPRSTEELRRAFGTQIRRRDTNGVTAGGGACTFRQRDGDVPYFERHLTELATESLPDEQSPT